jgi:KEOPS complex subunit Cgi121
MKGCDVASCRMGKGDLPCDIRQAEFTITDAVGFLREIRSIAQASSTAIICFDREKTAGRAHVQAALEHAYRACITDTAISNSFEMEALLYAAGTRQCAVATAFGVRAGENSAYIAICPQSDSALQALRRLVAFRDDEDWEEIDGEKRHRLMKIFSISSEELDVAGSERLLDLVLERVALLDVMK